MILTSPVRMDRVFFVFNFRIRGIDDRCIRRTGAYSCIFGALDLEIGQVYNVHNGRKISE